MKHVIALLGLIIVALLWVLPVYCFLALSPEHGTDWGLLWLPITCITVAYGIMIDSWYN